MKNNMNINQIKDVLTTDDYWSGLIYHIINKRYNDMQVCVAPDYHKKVCVVWKPFHDTQSLLRWFDDTQNRLTPPDFFSKFFLSGVSIRLFFLPTPLEIKKAFLFAQNRVSRPGGFQEFQVRFFCPG